MPRETLHQKFLQSLQAGTSLGLCFVTGILLYPAGPAHPSQPHPTSVLMSGTWVSSQSCLLSTRTHLS